MSVDKKTQYSSINLSSRMTVKTTVLYWTREVRCVTWNASVRVQVPPQKLTYIHVSCAYQSGEIGRRAALRSL